MLNIIVRFLTVKSLNQIKEILYYAKDSAWHGMASNEE